MLEIPGGLPKPKGEETPEETAGRELLEETGYKAEKVINLCVKPFFLAPHHNYRFFPLLGLGCVKINEPKPDSVEVLETVLVPLDEW